MMGSLDRSVASVRRNRTSRSRMAVATIGNGRKVVVKSIGRYTAREYCERCGQKKARCVCPA